MGGAAKISIENINVKEDSSDAVEIAKEQRNRFSKYPVTRAKILRYKSAAKSRTRTKKVIIAVAFSVTQPRQILEIQILYARCQLNKAKKRGGRRKTEAKS